MQCNEIRQSLNLYLDGVLCSEEQALIEAHLGGCDECAGELEAFSNVVGLVRSLPAETPDATVAEAILAAVQQTDSGARKRAVRSCAQTLPVVPAALDRELGAAEKQSLLAHLRECETCRHTLGEHHQVQMAVSSLPEVEAPDGLVSAILERTTRVPAPAYRIRPRPVRWGLVRWALAPVAAAAMIAIALLLPRAPEQSPFGTAREPAVATAPEATEPPAAVALAPAAPIAAPAEKTLVAPARSARAALAGRTKLALAQPRTTAGGAAEFLAKATSVRGTAVAAARPAAGPAAPRVRAEIAPAGPAAIVVAEAPPALSAPAQPLGLATAPGVAPKPAAVKLVRARTEPEPAATSVPERRPLAPVRSRPEEYALTPARDYSREEGRIETGLGSERYAGLKIALSSF